MPNYSNGKIYKIWSPSTGLTYIGSTTQSLSKRMSQHKAPSYKRSSKQVIDCGDARIDLVEYYSCSCKEELNRREGEFIQQMECVNKRIAGRTPKEYRELHREKYCQYLKHYYRENKDELLQKQKEYHNKHKDKISKQKKEYRSKNRDKILAQKKEYREKHRDTILKKATTKVTCECGCNISRSNLSIHKKSKKHQELLKMKQEEQK